MAPIHIAARQCDVEAIRRELQRGVDPDLTQGTSVNKTPPPEVLRKIAAFAFHAGFY